MTSYDDPSGGRVLDMGVEGAKSGTATFATGLRVMQGYFDPMPKPISLVKSKNGNIAICVFSAKLYDRLVDGLAVAKYEGHSLILIWRQPLST